MFEGRGCVYVVDCFEVDRKEQRGRDPRNRDLSCVCVCVVCVCVYVCSVCVCVFNKGRAALADHKEKEKGHESLATKGVPVREAICHSVRAQVDGILPMNAD